MMFPALPLSLLTRRFLSTHIFRRIKLPSKTELYEQTESRWLYNEVPQQELRRVHFNVEELVRVGCVAIGAETCLSIKKIIEGDYNRVFRLQFDNSLSLIASLPNSKIFGSGVSPVIASEVATMALMRKWELNTPRVLSWSKDQDNSIGWPYILMEDVAGHPLGDEWRSSEMGEKPAATLLANVKDHMTIMSDTPFSRLGSIYFPEDIPEVSQPSGIVSEAEQEVRVGPIANYLWWRDYHDEPHLDRGPWDTVEDYIKAAVRLERRAVERHRADPTSLIYTKSSVRDLLEIEHLLDKVDSFAPHVQTLFEHVSRSGLFMRNCLMHPNLSSHSIIVPNLTPENSVTRMKNPCYIDWEGTCVLPFALQWDVPQIAEYQPDMFEPNGEPVFPVKNYSVGEVPWPDYTNTLSPEQLEILSAEHRIATRTVDWNQSLLDVPEHYAVTDFHTRVYIRMMIHYVLRACAEGPYGLRFFLIHIKKDWDSKFREKIGPCPYTFTVDELERAKEADVQYMRFENMLTNLAGRLQSTKDGEINAEHYDTARKELARARLDWDEKYFGKPFPFQDGQYSELLR